MNTTRTGQRFLALVSSLLRPYNLSEAAANILSVVHGAGEPLPPKVIQERLLVTSGAITGVLDSLERRSLIRRLPHPRDRRMVLVDVTPEGVELLKQFRPKIHQLEVEMLSCLSHDEQETLIQLLGRIQAHLDERFPQPAERSRPSRVT